MGEVMEMRDPQYWGKLVGKSLFRYFLLSALYERPLHGYEIGKSVKECCSGCCEPSDAMIYPALHELLEGGYIECWVEKVGGRERKVCALTQKGIDAYRAASEVWGRVIPHLEGAVEMARGEKKDEEKVTKCDFC